MKSMVRGFVYEYKTPKIVTIHSITITLTCRLIQLLILFYGITYIMIHENGYQEINTSIISSITLKVKGIGNYQIRGNLIDHTDYNIPPQENNAFFLMTNFIRTDQENKRCAEASDIRGAICVNDDPCRVNKDRQRVNGKWTGRCLRKDISSGNISSQRITGLCEFEGWCPPEDDSNVPRPIIDALNFTIFVKNDIEFPHFRTIRSNIFQEHPYLKKCNYDPKDHKTCPIFRVETLLNLVEGDPDERLQMLTYGGVIRVKIDWKCNLDKGLTQCLPEYSFKRLDTRFIEERISPGFSFRFASHWKHQNRSFRTLTKAFGLRFVISVSGHASRFNVITLSLNIGLIIVILGLATFLYDIIVSYVHRQLDVSRQQKFQDVDFNLLRLETSNNSAEGMVHETTKRTPSERMMLPNHDTASLLDSSLKEKFHRNQGESS